LIAFYKDSAFDTFKEEIHPINVEEHHPGEDPPGYSQESAPWE